MATGTVLAVVTALVTAGPAEEKPAAANRQVLLGETTLWRAHLVWRTPVVIDGEGKVKPLTRRKGSGKGATEEPVPVWQSQAPPAGWAGVDFDDSTWARVRSPHGVNVWFSRYRGGIGAAGNPAEVQSIRLRGKFLVKDPAAARGLALSVRYAGGVVLYLNGREFARFHLPPGPVTARTVAERYPDSAYLRPDGKLINELFDRKTCADRIAGRIRQAREVAVPVELLRKGVNVLAVEVVRAPLSSLWFTAKFAKVDWHGPPTPWPHAAIERVVLTAPSGGAAVVPNVDRPRGFQVWNCTPLETVTVEGYGDPCEPLRPIRVVAALNGAFSGRLVVSSDGPIRGLRVEVTDLAQADGAGRIPAEAVLVRYALRAEPQTSWNSVDRFERLTAAAPAEVPLMPSRVRRRRGAPPPVRPGAVVPVWLTIEVPRDAAPGRYRGTVTVEADGVDPVRVPLEVDLSAWRVPDPKDFVACHTFIYSPDTLARYYKVPMWSKRHWELVGRSLELLGRVGGRLCLIELAIGYGSTNPSQSYVRWIRPARPGAPYGYDFSVLDRFLDLFAEKAGRSRVVRINAWGQSSHSKEPPLKVTVLDPATGKLSAMRQPPYGTEESFKFWKPVLDEVRKRLEERGWFDVTAVGYTSYCWTPSKESVSVYEKIWPDGKWFNTSHSNTFFYPGSGKGERMPVPYCEHIWSAGRLYDPDARGPGRYPVPWKRAEKRMEWGIPRVGMGIIRALRDSSPLVGYRFVSEAALQGNLCGIGHAGADFFPVRDERGRLRDLSRGLGAVGPRTNVRALLSPGPDGPAPNERYEMFREGVEVHEALVAVQKALEAGAFPPEAARKARDLLDQRARYYLRTRPGQPYHWSAFEAGGWQGRDAALFDLAAQAAEALGKKE